MNTEEPQSDAWLLRYVQNQIIKKIFIETNVSHNNRHLKVIQFYYLNHELMRFFLNRF